MFGFPLNEVLQWAAIALFLVLLAVYIRNHPAKVKAELASTEASVRRRLEAAEDLAREHLADAEAEARRILDEAKDKGTAALAAAEAKARELLAEAQDKLNQLRQ